MPRSQSGMPRVRGRHREKPWETLWGRQVPPLPPEQPRKPGGSWLGSRSDDCKPNRWQTLGPPPGAHRGGEAKSHRLVVCCCLTNSPCSRGLRQQTCIVSQLLGPESRCSSAGAWGPLPPEARIKEPHQRSPHEGRPFLSSLEGLLAALSFSRAVE